MDKRHIIEDAEFDISFDSIAVARKHEPGLADFIRERLLPLADEVFCELAEDGMVARIERLEVDLGDVRSSGFHDEMESRFRERLRSLLREKMQALASADSPEGSLVGRRQAERGQLETFLETGRMAWHVDLAAGVDADAMLRQTIAQQADAFAAFLRTTPHRGIVVKRLARQFPDSLLVDVMQLLAPAHAAILGELARKLAGVWQRQSGGIAASELKARVWERLLGAYLESGVPDPERLLGEVTKELLAGSSGDAHLVSGTPETERAGNIPRLRAFLETALGTGDAGALSDHWDSLRGEHRELVREVFKRRMGDARLQRKVAEGFPESMLRELVNILSPCDGSVMATLSGLAELHSAEGGRNAAFWAHALEYLHGPQGGDLAAYARSLIEKLSEPGEARHRLEQAMAAAAPELIEALAAAPVESAAPHTTAEAAPPAAGPLRVRLAYLRGLLDASLSGGSVGELPDAWDEIRTKHAGLVRERFVQLLGDESAQARVAHGWPENLLAELVRILAPAESGFIETVAARLLSGKNGSAESRRLWQHTLAYLHSSSGFDRRAYVENLLRDSGEHDETRTAILQAVAHADATLGEALSAAEIMRTREADEPLLANEETHAGALLRKVVRRLAGMREEVNIVDALDELERSAPAELAELLRGLQSGGLRAEVGVLDLREARQLVLALVRQNPGAGDFLRAIERFAGRAKSEAGYYRHILDSLIRNRTIDLEVALHSPDTTFVRSPQQPVAGAGEMAAEAGPGLRQGDCEAAEVASTSEAEPALESARLQRLRLEEALVLGRAEALGAIWGELLQNHAEMLREVFIMRMGDAGARTRLANGFPESMLLDLMHVLAPAEKGFFDLLVGQPELRADEAVAVKQLPFWEYTLLYLHACGLRGYDRLEYARGLIGSLAERKELQAAILQAVVRSDSALVDAVTMAAGETAPDETAADGKNFLPEAMRAGELLRLLLSRLRERDGTLAQEIGELAEAWPEVVREFYRQLQSGEARLDVAALSAQEAARHVAAFIAATHGRMGDEFRRDIDAHAGKAKSEQGYYRTVLEMLIRNRVVDIEAAMAALPGGEIVAEDDADRSVSRKASAPASGPLRVRFESALVQGNAEALADVWDELRFNRGNLVREVFQRWMGDGAIRKTVAERFPETMLFDLIRVLAPLASSFIENVEKQLGLQAGEDTTEVVRRTAREHALAYLHEHGARGFRRADYARDLMHRLALHGMENGVFLRTLAAIYPALALSLTDRDEEQANNFADNTVHAARLQAQLELAFATGDASGLAKHREVLRGEHRELVREVFKRRMGDARLQKKVAEGFPESMLRELVHILSPRDGSAMAALSGLPELRGAKDEKNAAFWHYTLSYLQGSQEGGLAAYVRGLVQSLSAQGMEQASLLQAVAALAPELRAVLADTQAEHAAGTMPPTEEPAITAAEPGRAAELYRRVTQRLNGTSREPEFAALVEEMANTSPEMLVRLQRQLQSGELRADIGMLDAREVAKMATVLAGVKGSELLLALESQAQHARDRQRYYGYILERLIRDEMPDLEAALDQAAASNDQNVSLESAVDTDGDNEPTQTRSPAHTLVETAPPAAGPLRVRLAYLRGLLDASLSGGSVGELPDAWDEIRTKHAGLVRERFVQLLGDESAQARVAHGWPENLLAELVRILAPAESGFIETVVARLLSGKSGVTESRRLWQHALAYLHSSSGFDRRAYVENLLRDLDEHDAARIAILQAVAHADAALGEALSAAGVMRTREADEPLLANEETHAGALLRKVVRRLAGMRDEMNVVDALDELERSAPAELAELLRGLQSGGLRAEVGVLDLREARQLVLALVRQNPGAGDFLRAIERFAGRAKSEAGYYRHILDSLIRNRDVDLEAAAEAVPQESVPQVPAEVAMVPDDERGQQTKPDSTPPALAKADAMQGRDAAASDGFVDDEESGDEIYIANAGMVLATPYLPQLFRMLELTEGTKFRDGHAAERAIHLLQFMVNESCDSPEFLLPLNKLLCGVPTVVPIVREIELLQREKDAIEGMLTAVIKNWSVLGSTSVQGLRESFLQRNGRLVLKEDSWHLKVESRGIDVLLDRLPWSISLIRHPWMARPIFVEWR